MIQPRIARDCKLLKQNFAAWQGVLGRRSGLQEDFSPPPRLTPDEQQLSTQCRLALNVCHSALLWHLNLSFLPYVVSCYAQSHYDVVVAQLTSPGFLTDLANLVLAF